MPLIAFVDFSPRPQALKTPWVVAQPHWHVVILVPPRSSLHPVDLRGALGFARLEDDERPRHGCGGGRLQSDLALALHKCTPWDVVEAAINVLDPNLAIPARLTQ